MALRMTERDVSGVTVLDIEGRIVLGEESNSFREKVKSLLAAGKKNIVLNLAQVSYIDSAGLGTLVATFHSARSQGAALKLVNLGTKFKEVLQVTKLMTVFVTYDTEAAAIQSFGKSKTRTPRAGFIPFESNAREFFGARLGRNAEPGADFLFVAFDFFSCGRA